MSVSEQAGKTLLAGQKLANTGNFKAFSSANLRFYKAFRFSGNTGRQNRQNLQNLAGRQYRQNRQAAIESRQAIQGKQTRQARQKAFRHGKQAAIEQAAISKRLSGFFD